MRKDPGQLATEITCNVSDGDDPDEGIDSLGGPGWLKDEATVIAEVEAGREYFVEVSSARVRVVVAEREGRKYLRTDPDETSENNLLSLPSCP
jgi:hypothetical protein